jgi:hypothetical protein
MSDFDAFKSVAKLGTEIAEASVVTTSDYLAKAHRTQAEYLYRKTIDAIAIGDAKGTSSSASSSKGNSVTYRQADLETLTRLAHKSLEQFWEHARQQPGGNKSKV